MHTGYNVRLCVKVRATTRCDKAPVHVVSVPGYFVMQTVQSKAEPNLFEITLYFEGNSWQFSTSARASFEQDALEQAEKEFSVHSFQHRLGNMRVRATSAHIAGASDGRSFAKRDGKWQRVH
jgi:hypothetical protein